MLYLTEPIDEPALNSLGNYEDHVFVDVTREGLELTGDSEEEKKKVPAPLTTQPTLGPAQILALCHFNFQHSVIHI